MALRRPAPPPRPGALTVLIAAAPRRRRFLERLLGESGHLAVAVEDSEELLDAVTANAAGYDAVLLDWSLPDRPGLEAAKAVRFLEGGSRVHLVVLSAPEEAHAACLDAGIDSVLGPPLQPRRLLDVLDRLNPR